MRRITRSISDLPPAGRDSRFVTPPKSNPKSKFNCTTSNKAVASNTSTQAASHESKRIKMGLYAKNDPLQGSTSSPGMLPTLHARTLNNEQQTVIIYFLQNSIGVSADENGCFVVERMNGYLIVEPDRHMSVTSVVTQMYCERKAALLHFVNGGIGGGDNAIMYREVVEQECLRLADDDIVSGLMKQVESQATRMVLCHVVSKKFEKAAVFVDTSDIEAFESIAESGLCPSSLGIQTPFSSQADFLRDALKCLNFGELEANTLTLEVFEF
ncbi:unnamed protein product [Orchesella dallaii]|uniref:DNA replication factor Dna2 N-terminal domain-containing protein n=1 Tax=Orchesella dallaii TaxID=48710 RepID=A0ABP1R762_9HEXA